MKLSLDDLKVDSYAIQVSETELAEVKGGTAWLCVDLGVAVATLAVAGYNAWKSSSSGGSSGGSNSGGLGSGGTAIYNVDSIKVVNPNGTTTTYFGVDSIKSY